MAAANDFITTRPDARYGDQYATVTADLSAAIRFQCPGTGTIEISEIGYYGYTSGTSVVHLGIFTDDAVNGNPDTLVTDSDSGEISVPGSAAVIYHTYSTAPQLTGGNYYWLAVQGDGSNSYLSRFATGGTAVYRSDTYPTWPVAAAWDSITDSASDYSLYALVAAPAAPTVTASAPTLVTATTATGNGNVTSDGAAAVTDRGICWGASADPDLSGSHSHADAGGTGAFTALITGLSAATTYHYRTFATNSVGTSYSADATFGTDGALTLTRPDTFAILVEGTYGGSPTGIEAQFNGGSWVEIDASPTGGTFSAYLTGLAAASGTLAVRHADNTGVTDSEGGVSVGEAGSGASPRIGDRNGGLR